MNINSLSEYEKSLLLQYYCLSGDVNGVRFALSQGADINRPNRDKVVPLHLACAIDHIDVVRLLVRCGADLLYRNPLYKNQNALEISQDRDSHKTVAFLKSVLHQNGQKETDEHASDIQHGDWEVETESGEHNWVPDVAENQDILLLMYARDNNLNGVREKLFVGANIEFRDFAGRTPLFQAAWRGYDKVVSFLLSEGANVNAGNDTLEEENHRRSPILAAILSSHFDTARILQQAGANVDVPDERGRTLLHDTARSLAFSADDIASRLLEFGANARPVTNTVLRHCTTQLCSSKISMWQVSCWNMVLMQTLVISVAEQPCRWQWSKINFCL